MRTFVGIELPDKMKRNLLALQSQLKQHGVHGSWKSAENFHITLEFLGDLEPDAVPMITDTLSKVARNQKPFSLTIGGLGAFPSFKRPHTLWAAVGDGSNELCSLREKIHRSLTRSGLVLEKRNFVAHVTLSSRPKLDNKDLTFFMNKEIGRLDVEDVVLFESRIIEGKRMYPVLFKAPFGAE